MSTEYVPFIGVGKTFDNFALLWDFLHKYNLTQGRNKADVDLEELAFDLNLDMLYLGMDDVYFCGFKYTPDSLVGLVEQLQTSPELWNHRFPHDSCELIHTVDSY